MNSLAGLKSTADDAIATLLPAAMALPQKNNPFNDGQFCCNDRAYFVFQYRCP